MNDTELRTRLKAHSEHMKSHIDAPFDIAETICEMEMNSMNKKTASGRLNKTLYSAAAAAAAFALLFNCAPTLAYAASDIPILCDVVRIVTFGRFELQEENYEAIITTPKIEGLVNKDLEHKLNKELAENANTVIAAFEQDLKTLCEAYGDNSFHLSVMADYAVKTDNETVLALDFYITSTEASAATTHRFYNIDKKAGTLITLDSLFEDNADYVSPISRYIINEMRKQNESGTGSYFIDEDTPNKFEKIKVDQNFYINNNSNLVICFDEYEVAAGAQGSPEFEIPGDIIKTILK